VRPPDAFDQAFLIVHRPRLKDRLDVGRKRAAAWRRWRCRCRRIARAEAERLADPPHGRLHEALGLAGRQSLDLGHALAQRPDQVRGDIARRDRIALGQRAEFLLGPELVPELRLHRVGGLRQHVVALRVGQTLAGQQHVPVALKSLAETAGRCDLREL
jgi:hypothetical protein